MSTRYVPPHNTSQASPTRRALIRVLAAMKVWDRLPGRVKGAACDCPIDRGTDPVYWESDALYWARTLLLAAAAVIALAGLLISRPGVTAAGIVPAALACLASDLDGALADRRKRRQAADLAEGVS